MERFNRIFSGVEETAVFWVCSPIIIVMIGYVSVNVIGRYFFNHPIERMWETVGVLMVPLVFLVMAYGWRTGVTFLDIRFLAERFGKSYSLILAYITHFIGFFVWSGLLGYTNFMDTIWAYRSGHSIGSFSTAVVTWPFRLSISLSCILLAVRIIISFINLVKKKHEEEKDVAKIA